MGLADRDYSRDDGSAPRGATSFNTILIIVNVAIFVLGAFSQPLRDALRDYGHFSTHHLFKNLEFWRLISFQFLHANLLHLFFNMLGLWIFGKWVEDQLGSKMYAAFYLVCGIFGGVAYCVLNGLGWLSQHYGLPRIPGLLINDTTVNLVGASAGVFGVIMACAFLSPNAVIQLLFPPIPLKMRTFAYAYVGIAVVNLFINGPSGANNAGGDAAHLGGAAAGYFFIRNKHLLRDFFDVFSDSRKARGGRARGGSERSGAWVLGERGPREKTGGLFGWLKGGKGKGRGAGGTRAMDGPRADRKVDARDAEVDRVLDKVAQQGLHSLSEREKRVLREATQRQQRAG
ncbi:MAG: rhomboid family intramembrane serine protease [Planctomycetota bacterium]|nr:rhomboid family intramembrane serine protease [Planctomycetota bacterium]